MSLTHRRSPRVLVLAVSMAVTIGACSGAGPSAPASTAETTAPPVPPASEPSGDAWLVVGESGQAGLTVVLASTREALYELPLGVPDDMWGQIVTTNPDGSATRVEEITVQPDLPSRVRSVDGAWRLPTLGLDSLPVGVSADGSKIALVEVTPGGDGATSRFAIVARGEATHIIELPGSFDYDALSPDGSILYVVEHLAAPPEGHYQVRAVDVATGLLREAVIVDKRNLDASMGGRPITQLRHEGGVVFTLYRGTGYTFIHALNSREAWAICLALPMSGADDDEAANDWGLAQTADGHAVFAVNVTLGLSVAIDPGELTISAAAPFDAPRAETGISLAKFGHQEGGPVGRRVVLTPDGSTIYAAGAGGIVRIAADGLTLIGHVLEGAAIDALAMTPDGAFLYALLPGEGRIVKIYLASGQIVATVPGDGFDRLVAVVPW